MWNFLLGYLFAGATLQSRVWRLILLVVLIGALVAGIIYASIVFNALTERSSDPHVQHHSTY
jgi:4-hydroxybenzoate polyprenyltransferase